MPYVLDPAANPLAIAECQYGSANAVPMSGGTVQPTVRFTRFTSCIGLVGASANAASAIGIHLVVINAQNERFTATDVPTVVAQMAGFRENVQIVGHVGVWENNLAHAYNELVAALGNPPVTDLGDGIYGAGFNNVGQLVILHQP